MNTIQTGSAAEQAVALELAKQGYEVLDLNWRTKFAEIDIVVRHKNVIYFVEVKYRQSDVTGDGFDYITPTKLHHMQRAAEAWVFDNAWKGEYQLLAAAVSKNYASIDLREIA